jgi:hypothetical protein
MTRAYHLLAAGSNSTGKASPSRAQFLIVAMQLEMLATPIHSTNVRGLIVARLTFQIARLRPADVGPTPTSAFCATRRIC